MTTITHIYPPCDFRTPLIGGLSVHRRTKHEVNVVVFDDKTEENNDAKKKKVEEVNSNQNNPKNVIFDGEMFKGWCNILVGTFECFCN